MKAQFVYENIDFTRGKDPRRVMKVGRIGSIQNEFEEDWYEEFSPSEALVWACARKKFPYIEYLIGHPEVDINYKDGNALANLLGGYGRNQGENAEVTEILKFILNSGIKIEKGTLNRGLEEAVQSGNLESVKLLIDAGAQINNSEALKNAAWRSSSEVAEYLFSRGAKIPRDSDLIKSGLSHDLDLDMIKVFLKNGLRLNKGDTDFINRAAMKGDSEAIKFLLGLGIQVNNNSGGDALINAAASGDVESVKLLMNAGANPNYIRKDSDYYVEYHAPLVSAAERGRLDVVKYMLANGADIFILKDKAHRMARKEGEHETLQYIKDYKKELRKKLKK